MVSMPPGTGAAASAVAQKTGELARAAWSEIKAIYARRQGAMEGGLPPSSQEIAAITAQDEHYGGQRATQAQVRSYFLPIIMAGDGKKYLQRSAAMLLSGKLLGLMAPFILRRLVNSMSVSTVTTSGGAAALASGFAPGPFVFWKAAAALVAWGAARSLSTVLTQYHMVEVTRLIQGALRRVSNSAFEKLHSLDLKFHKKGSRGSIFAINKALRSMEQGLRFTLGFFSGMVVETVFLGAALGAFCGPVYLGNMAVTLAAYVAFTRGIQQERMDLVRNKKDTEKAQEFLQNESITNYESVKAFSAEGLE